MARYQQIVFLSGMSLVSSPGLPTLGVIPQEKRPANRLFADTMVP